MSIRRPADDLFNWTVIGGVVVLVLHSMRRHRAVFAITWLTVVALSVGLMLGLSKTYEVQTTLQVQRTQGLAAIGGPSPKETDAPTRAAAAMVFQHENLIALINQTDLLEAWFVHRAPLLRLKDAIQARLFGPRTKDQRVEEFVGLLEKQLWVATSEGGVVTIGIRFPDPRLAFLLVDGALENFLEARHTAEVSAIGEEITILQGRADEAREQLERSLEELQSLRAARATRLGKHVRRLEPLVPLSPDDRSSQLQGEVDSKRRAIADLEEFRRHRITQLETVLEEQKALYSENHPVVQDTLKSLEAVRHESAQVVSLRRELTSLEAELKRQGRLSSDLASASQRSARLAALQNAAFETEDPRETEDPDIEYAKSQLKFKIKQYNGLLDNIQSARLQEDTAGAAFKYRYSIIKPPQRPKSPVAPRPTLVFISSVLAGFLLGVLGTAFIDVSSRRFHEAWQVEHALGVPLLGVIRLP